MTEKKTNIKQEVELVKKEAFAKISIKSDDELKTASDYIQNIVTLRKKIEKAKTDYTKPARQIVKKANDMYNPYIAECKNAKTVLEEHCLKYMLVQKKKREQKEAEIAKKLEDGKIKKTETALRHIDKLPEAPKRAEGETSTLRLRTHKVLNITDESKLPREFLVPDTIRIKKALEAGISVPGAELQEVTKTASYGK